MQPQQSQHSTLKMGQSELLYLKNPHDPFSKDIIPGVYEGGLKVWECTIDLLKYISSHPEQIINKNILELGCGHGLIGIGALKLGGKSCNFQDFNKQVIENVTIPNCSLNKLQSEKCRYSFGDWDSLKLEEGYFDLLLGSQLIYREENYAKIIKVCKKYLKPEGKCILANKHYYFGVGGNMPSFKDAIEEEGLEWRSLLKIDPPKGGNKKEIIEIRNK